MDFRRQMNDLCACIFRQDELYDIWAKHSGMKPSTVTVLYMLDQFSEMTQGGIAQMCLLPKQTIHTVVQELEQAGYLEKGSVSGRKEKPLRPNPASATQRISYAVCTAQRNAPPLPWARSSSPLWWK